MYTTQTPIVSMWSSRLYTAVKMIKSPPIMRKLSSPSLSKDYLIILCKFEQDELDEEFGDVVVKSRVNGVNIQVDEILLHQLFLADQTRSNL